MGLLGNMNNSDYIQILLLHYLQLAFSLSIYIVFQSLLYINNYYKFFPSPENVQMSFGKSVSTIHTGVGSFYVQAWFFFSALKFLDTLPLMTLHDLVMFVSLRWLLYPFSSIIAWLSASTGLRVSESSLRCKSQFFSTTRLLSFLVQR